MITTNNELLEVLQGRWSVFARKVRTVLSVRNKVFLYSIHAFWAIPVLITIRVIKPFLFIRVGVFHYQRIGHFAADVGQRKAESLIYKSIKRFDFWFLPDDYLCSNAYWSKIARRWFKVHPLVRYLWFWNRIVPFGGIHSINSSGTHHSRDVNGFLDKAKLSFPCTPDEEKTARTWMNKFGWTEGNPFVCLLVRDSKYLSNQFPEHKWNYHSYRDSDIQTYVKAIEYLTAQGIFVFRMGRDMASRVNYSHHKFIDYAFCEDRSDFLDVWLFSNCSLCITTGSGPDMISDVFRRPILALNFLPLHGLWSWSNALHYPKILRWNGSGSLLSLNEHLTSSYRKTFEYEDAGIVIIDLTEDQILDSVKESWERLTGSWTLTIEEKEADEKFRDILMSHPYFRNFHGFVHSDSRLATTFLSFAGHSFLT